MDCKAVSAVTMTKGKPQRIGPAVQLKNGLTWEKLAEITSFRLDRPATTDET